MGRAETRERLIEAAAHLFYERGIHRTGVEQVIERAHLSKPTLYQHFRSKDELVTAVLERWAVQREEILREILEDPSRPPAERLLAVFRFFEGWVQEGGFRGCGLVNAAVEIPGPEDAGRRIIARHKVWMTRALARAARQAGLSRPMVLARSLTLLIEGATVTSHVQQDPGAPRLARSIARRLIDEHSS
ncbi:MAG: TetR/AcrR family transcriptional regulator [Acidobacteria bacterium]|nr:TetR/AcrR family transcriptional regulator [Acidobacteriota bacterium]